MSASSVDLDGGDSMILDDDGFCGLWGLLSTVSAVDVASQAFFFPFGYS